MNNAYLREFLRYISNNAYFAYQSDPNQKVKPIRERTN